MLVSAHNVSLNQTYEFYVVFRSIFDEGKYDQRDEIKQWFVFPYTFKNKLFRVCAIKSKRCWQKQLIICHVKFELKLFEL